MESYTLITGASSGIGRELARYAATKGKNLVLVARNTDHLNDLAAELKNVTVKVYTLDLSEAGSAKSLTSQLAHDGISVNTLINNAGVGDTAPFIDSNLAKQQSMMQLNIMTLTELTHLLLPGIIEGRGNILNVASVAGFLPGPLMSVYFASKSYVVSFSEALHEELRTKGVNVSCLCPGPVKTGFGAGSNASPNSYLERSTTTAEQVAKAGWDGMIRNKAIIFVGFRYKLAVFALRFIPRFVLRRLVHKINA